ncbi:MAG: Ig-like domain-containing protein [Deltaproteobacteria bacterium]|nr:Ig-like domain-containing protein [Deltaproteobacteria bacterium]
MVYILLTVFAVLAGCGSPMFEIEDGNKTSDTFVILYFFPSTDNAKNMKIDVPIIFIFSESIDISSALKGLNIERTGPGQRQNVKPKCVYSESEMMLQCLPESGKWEFKSNYSVKIKDVKSKDGKKNLDKEYNFIFSTI